MSSAARGPTSGRGGPVRPEFPDQPLRRGSGDGSMASCRCFVADRNDTRAARSHPSAHDAMSTVPLNYKERPMRSLSFPAVLALLLGTTLVVGCSSPVTPNDSGPRDTGGRETGGMDVPSMCGASLTD